MDSIRGLSLDEHFSRVTLKAAEPLAMQRYGWVEPLAWFRPDGGDADALQCEVVDAGRASKLVDVYLYPLFGRTQIESSCTCTQPLCVHAAALLIRLQKLLAWPRALTPLERWGRSIEKVRSSPAHVPGTETHEALRVVCLLHVESHHRPAVLFGRLVLLHDLEDLRHRERWVAVETVPSPTHLSAQAMMWQARLVIGEGSQRSSAAGYLLEGPAGASLLSELLQNKVCFHAETLQPIRGAPARAPQWQWTRDARGEARLVLQLEEAAAQLIDLGGLHYLDESTGEFGELKLSRRAWAMLEHMPAIPPGDTEIRAHWPPHPLLRGVPSPPPDPPLREIRAPAEPILTIGASRHPGDGDYVFYLRAWADYGGCRLPLGEEPWRQRIVRRLLGEYVILQREIDREIRAAQALAAADIISLKKLMPDSPRTLIPAPDAQALAHRQHFRGGRDTFTALESIAQSFALAGFRVEYDSELPFVVLAGKTELEATLTAREAAGWTLFELAAITEDGEINVLPTILDGIKRKAFPLKPVPGEAPNAHWLAPIGPDLFLPLPLSRLRDWLGPLTECLDSPSGTRKGLDLSRSQTIALSERLQQQGVTLRGTEARNVAEMLAALRDAQKSAILLTGPRSFRGTLRPYQRVGVQWLQALRQSRLGGVLADDMGLGKTVQVIAHLLLEWESGRLKRPALIVVPTSLVFNWVDEIARFAPPLRCLDFTSAARGAQPEELRGGHVILVSYALLAMRLECLEAIDFSILVLDEAQWIKNPLTQTARAVRRLRADHRLVVTGTPLENHLGELWAHMDAVMPGLLGDYRSFNRSFRVPIERQEDDARMSILRQRIAPFLLRRNKVSVAPELPPKTETVLRVAMAEPQRRLYESLRLSLSKRVRDALASYNDQQSRIVVLSALLRLRQVCCDPRLLGGSHDGAASAKLDTLLQLVRSLREQGRQVLVFSQFTAMLDLISNALSEVQYEHALLTGKTTDRGTPVRRFQRGDVHILLASLKAGGVGLNLTAADAVIHYDPWWNPAVERQAVDRSHRLGREQPVFVYKLLCDDTIEDKIEAMKDRKSDLADSLLGPHGAASTTRLDDLDVGALFDLTSSTHPVAKRHRPSA